MTTLADQIKEVRRELGMRTGVYPHMVARGNLTQAAAESQTEAMKGVLATLLWVEKLDEDAQRIANALTAKRGRATSDTP